MGCHPHCSAKHLNSSTPNSTLQFYLLTRHQHEETKKLQKGTSTGRATEARGSKDSVNIPECKEKELPSYEYIESSMNMLSFEPPWGLVS